MDFQDSRRSCWQRQSWTRICVFFSLSFLAVLFSLKSILSSTQLANNETADSWCPLPEKFDVAKDRLHPSSDFNDDGVLRRQVERLSEAVKVPTISYGGEVNDGDERWEVFPQLHSTLRRLFPLVHEKLELEMINDYGLLFIFKGSSLDLKPILFMAHQDVVPAPPEKWSHPPFEPYFDGKWLWGRGASDCKNNLIGLLSVAEDLISQNWKPSRSIMFAFGFDEEIGGERGAAFISAHLENKLGKNGIFFIHDEGGMGFDATGDVVYALPAVAEKGFLDVALELEVSGGHSSRPPPHTGIGIMSQMVVALEQHPFSPVLSDNNPFRGYMECEVRWSPNNVESWLKDALIRHVSGEKIGPRLASERGNSVRYSIQTSQAVDIIHSGSNADNQLPESVQVIVNLRIAPHDSIESVKHHIVEVIRPIAHQHHLALKGFASEEADSSNAAGSLTVTSNYDLSPSPLSPTDENTVAWNIFAGTIRQVFEDTDKFGHKTVVPVGSIMTGNTDTIHYWNLSRNIYRFTPAADGSRQGVHTVDERLEMAAHIDGMRVYYDLMRNADLVKDT